MNTPIVAGKYALLKKIASGGMAEVFLAKQIGFDGFEKLVVLKRILPHLSGNPEFTRMFLDEARTAADLRHPHLVQTYEIGEEAGVYFMVMEFLHGQDVRTLFKTASLQKQAIPLPYAVGIVMDAASGIHHAHIKADLHGKPLGIVHRDVSPQNIIITYEGLVKIVDFGIAKAAHQIEETATGVLKGKYCYMSPEQALGEPIDAYTDQFALGVILYELTTMRRLFRRDTEAATLKAIMECKITPPIALSPDYPPLLSNIVMRALHKDKQQRFENSLALRLELEAFLEKSHLTYSTTRLSQYMHAAFQDRIVQEEKALVQGQLDAESLLTLLWPSSRHTTSSSSKDRKRLKEEQTANTKSVSQSLWQHASVGVFALIGGGLGVFLVVVAVHLFLSSQPETELPIPIAAVPIEPLPAPPIPSASPQEKAPVQRANGRLKVVVDPWAEVYVNGELIGVTPLSPRALPPGRYTIRLVNPQLQKNITKRIVIASSRDTLIRYKW